MSKRQVKTYTEEFRQSSAKLAVESGQSVSTIAQELGIHEVTLHGWKSGNFFLQKIRFCQIWALSM